MNVIEVDDLTKIYNTGMRKGSIVALDEVSLTVQQGEIVGLLGPNGAGKTTLFKSLLNITRPSSGRCMISGLPSSNPRSRQKVGYLPENHRFPDHLTGISLLRLTANMFGLKNSEIDERMRVLLEMVDMDKWGSMKIKKYSKGMLQRIGLAQALISDPEILLLDEPTDGVDPVGKIELREVFSRVRDEGKSIVLNSHLLSEVESIADRVIILQRGKVLKTGTVEELTSKKSHYIIEAEIGHHQIEVPEKIGKRISISTKNMVVEIANVNQINELIMLFLMKKIPIKSVKPLKVSLEQSFIEAVTDKEMPS